jgi:hypothetical protein
VRNAPPGGRTDGTDARGRLAVRGGGWRDGATPAACRAMHMCMLHDG